MAHQNPLDSELRVLLSGNPTIAMVGASSKPDRPSHEIMNILVDAGFRVIPVNPRETAVLGRRAYPTLEAIPDPVDIVDVFRSASEAPAIADSAAKIGARVLWLQLGIVSEEAAERAAHAGLVVVMDKCIGQTVRRLRITASRTTDLVDLAGRDSFPASDPPPWVP
jgi:predicted CoA-binding protein